MSVLMRSVVAALVCGLVLALAGCAAAASATSFCDKYSMALFNATDGATETKLVSAIVVRAVLGDSSVKPPVPGIVGADSPLLKWFNGSLNYRHDGEPAAPDYLTDSKALAELAAHFVSFLGASLGCTGTPFNLTDYNPDLQYVHELMHIRQQEEDYFNAQFALTLLSFGVTVDDLDSVVVPFLGLFQRGAGMNHEICREPDCWPVANPVGFNLTFCEKYAYAVIGNATGLGEVILLTAVVITTVFGTTDTQHGVMVDGLAAADSPLLAILNGSVPYRHSGSPPDYLNNTKALARLATKFVEFFGQALGCASYGFPHYRATGNHTQHYIHENMGIDAAKMAFFDTQVANTLVYYGVPPDGPDIAAAAAFLHSFDKGAGDNEICTEDDCPKAPGSIVIPARSRPISAIVSAAM